MMNYLNQCKYVKLKGIKKLLVLQLFYPACNLEYKAGFDINGCPIARGK
jgi:hypothetical protein